MKKIGLLCLAIVLALGSLGVGYAAWTDTITITGSVTTGEVCMDIQCPIGSVDGPLSYLTTGYEPAIPAIYGQDWNATVIGPGFHLNPVQRTKNVGWVTNDCAQVPSPRKEVTVTLHNVYPSYWDHLSLGIHNCGTIPLRLEYVTFLDANDNLLIGYDETGAPVTTIKQNTYVKFDLSNNGIFDVEIYWGDNWAVQIEPSDSWDISFWIHVLQDEGIDFSTPQNFTFKAAITGVQWNEYGTVPLPPH